MSVPGLTGPTAAFVRPTTGTREPRPIPSPDERNARVLSKNVIEAPFLKESVPRADSYEDFDACMK